MKNNGKFIALTVSLLLASTALLAGCMEGLTVWNPKEKTFDSDEGEDIQTLLDLAAQAEMQEKFSVYSKTETDVDGKTTLTLFPDGQVETLLEKRKSEAPSLSYGEILFLINDSAQLYNKYDVIVLNDANKLGLAPIALSGPADWVIYPDHADSDEQMAQGSTDIYTIILYRIYLLDARLTRYYERYNAAISSYVYSGQISLTPITGEFPYFQLGMRPVKTDGYALAIEDTGREDYSELLQNCLLQSRFLPFADRESIRNSLDFPKDTLLIDFRGNRITLSREDAQTRLYPAEEVLPGELRFETDQITIGICGYPLKFPYQTQTLTGKEVKRLLDVLDPKSVIPLLDAPSVDSPGDYFCYYAVSLDNGTEIAIPFDGEPGVAAVTTGSEYLDEQSFKKCVPEAFTRLVIELYTAHVTAEIDSHTDYPAEVREELKNIPTECYKQYAEAFAKFVKAVERDPKLYSSVIHDFDACADLPEYQALEQLVLSDKRYGYIVLRNNRQDLWTNIALNLFSRHNEDFRTLYDQQPPRSVVEEALSDPGKYLPY